MIRAAKAVFALLIFFLATFHVSRYTWVLWTIWEDGGIYLFEPSMTMLKGEVALASCTAALLIILFGFHIGRIAKRRNNGK